MNVLEERAKQVSILLVDQFLEKLDVFAHHRELVLAENVVPIKEFFALL